MFRSTNSFCPQRLKLVTNHTINWENYEASSVHIYLNFSLFNARQRPGFTSALLKKRKKKEKKEFKCACMRAHTEMI